MTLPSAAECTFIVLDPSVPDTPGTGTHGGGEGMQLPVFPTRSGQQPDRTVTTRTLRRMLIVKTLHYAAGMVGDVNLFFNDADDRHGTAEVEVRRCSPG